MDRANLKCENCGHTWNCEETERKDRCPKCRQNYFLSRHALRVKKFNNLKNKIKHINEEFDSHVYSVAALIALYVIALKTGLVLGRGGALDVDHHPVVFWSYIALLLLLILRTIIETMELYRKKKELKNKPETNGDK